MMLHFTKMNGAGNGFVMVDNREGKIPPEPRTIAAHDRHRGVGRQADRRGTAVATPISACATTTRMAAKWRCAAMARCFTTGLPGGLQAAATASASKTERQGDLRRVCGRQRSRLGMKRPMVGFARIAAGTTLTVHSLSTGVPHAVVVVEDLDGACHGIRRVATERFAPKGTNANFIKPLDARRWPSAPTGSAAWKETWPASTGVTAVRCSMN